MQTGYLDTGKVSASDWLDKGLFAKRTPMSQQEGQKKKNDMDELGEQIQLKKCVMEVMADMDSNHEDKDTNEIDNL